jgi:60 kDa SS-A/Ro ribonucleoprotein
MANCKIFGSKSVSDTIAKVGPAVDTVNPAGGVAYAYGPEHALTQFLLTGCFNGAYYASDEKQLEQFITLAGAVDDEFLAKAIVFARTEGFMKDAPAAGWALLLKRNKPLFHKVASRIVNGGKMLLTGLQMCLTPALSGKDDLSYSPQRAFETIMNEVNDGFLLSASVGNNPSLNDVIGCVRPKPPNNARRSLYGWLLGRPVEKWAPAVYSDLPEEIRLLDAYRKAETEEQQLDILDQISKTYIRWDLLSGEAKGDRVWGKFAKSMGPQALRMNLNGLLKHKVFEDPEMVEFVAKRLEDEDEVRRGKQFPYGYFAAYKFANDEMPQKIKQALHVATEASLGNVPKLPGPVIIGVDVSGSMSCPITGARGSGSSAMRCIDVAALYAAAVLRSNPDSVIVPFDDAVHQFKCDPGDKVLSIADRLAKFGGGGTNVHLPVSHANTMLANRAFAGVVMVSDNCSWVSQPRSFGYHSTTELIAQWTEFKDNQRKLGKFMNPRMVCIDLQMYGSTQASERDDVLNVGGFSDLVFKVIAGYLEGGDGQRLVDAVKRIAL